MGVVVALCAATPAAAHAIVERTEPGIDEVIEASPDSVLMHFNEPIEVAFGAIRVFDTDGQRVDSGEVGYVPGDANAVQVALEPDLPDGTYTVTWRVISADAHVISEAFVFHVGAPGAKPQGIADQLLAGQGGSALVDGLLGVFRAVGFGSLIVLVGALCFLLYIFNVVADGDPPQGFFVRWRAVVVYAWIACLAATLLALPLQASQAGGLSLAEGFSPRSLSGVLGTRFGTVMAARSLVLIIGVGLWAWAPRRGDLRSGAAEAAFALFSLGLLSATAFAGHAGSTPPVWVNVPVDVLHLAGVAAWIGGLVVLVGAVFPAYRRSGDVDTLGSLVARFSDVAVAAVVVVVITGVWQSFVEVKVFRAFATPYGWTLLTKLALFLPLLGLGAFNNRWAKPRIEQASEEGDRERGLGVLRKIVTVEVVLAVFLVGVTAFLVNLPPARVAAGVDGPFVTDVDFEEGSLNVLVDPNRVGENEVHLTVSTPSGAAADIKDMRVQFTMPQESIGPLIAEGERLAPGHYVVQGSQLSVPGSWTLEVIARVSRFDEVRVRVPVLVNR